MFRSASFFALGALLILALLENVAAASAGCGKTPKLTNGVHTTTINGKQRRWTLRIPNGYDKSRQYRFIFGIHWLNGDMNAVAGGSSPYYGLAALGGDSTIFVAPDGLNRGWANQGGEDITFLNTIRKQVEDDLCINEKLRFSVGFSYGAAMSYSLACSSAQDYRGIAVLSGAQLSGCSGGNAPIAFYGQHGTRDSVLNISAGRQIRDRFVKNNGCQAKNAPEPPANSGRSIKTVYEGCRYPTQWTAFDGDHVALQSFTSGDVWKFFSQFT